MWQILIIIYLIQELIFVKCLFVLIKEYFLGIKEVFISNEDLYIAVTESVSLGIMMFLIVILALIGLLIPFINYIIVTKILDCELKNPFYKN